MTTRRSRVRFSALAGSIVILQVSALPAGGQTDPRFSPPQAVAQGRSVLRDTIRVTKVADRETAVAGTFAVPPHALFDAITKPEHLTQWMGAAGMTLEDARVDPRAGGGFRFVFRRPSGRTIEVQGAYRTFDPPRGFAYLETYDFSPLRIEVTTGLEDARGETRFTQTLRYASAHERDEDFEPLASSSREAYARLAQYLASRAP